MTDAAAPAPSSRALPWWLAWAAMAVIVVIAVAIGASREDGPQTAQDRVTGIAHTIRCPTCQGETVADSSSVAAKAIRIDIADRIAKGQTDEEIRDYYSGPTRYGPEALLTPTATGVVGLVWIIPVVVGALAVAGLVLAFYRWRQIPAMTATDADRDLVADAQRDRHDDDEPDADEPDADEPDTDEPDADEPEEDAP